MPAYKETPAPPAGPLHVGYWDARDVVHGWRPKGSKDWLLLYTASGHCLMRGKDWEFTAASGDVLLYQPGTPQDYGMHDPRGRWRHVWVHWMPRPEAREWLSWPELQPGLRRLQLPLDLRAPVLRELLLADSTLRSRTHRSELLAINALERALLFCSRANPGEGQPHWHPRIQQAVDYLGRNLSERELLENLARRFGFSRSRFAAHFRRQVGQTPGQYLEAQRLAKARQLLAYTQQSLAQIAAHVGFSSPFYLSLRFKQHFGQSPRTFRQQSQA